MDTAYIAATALVCMKWTLYFLAAYFLLSGVDELFIDFIVLRMNARKWLYREKGHPLTDEELFSKPEQRIAIIVPCWDESAVIRRMLENTLKVLNYKNYVIFVGAYPNDPATHREVELIRAQTDKVELIICPKDGPTSKADCLNWVYAGVRLNEKETGKPFDIIAMDDSEDIVHPLMLKLYNRLIPRVDMVQLPVFPMEVPWHKFTAGHYMDEFAENHTRDMLARERLTGAVPSAGVGTAFSHAILEKLAAGDHNQIFTIGSLTEDYDLGFRLHKIGAKQIFARSTKPGRSPFHLEHDIIAIREFFPSTFRTAVRQKARWITGIALQGWSRVGWQGSLGLRYMLMRDRKSIFSYPVGMVGNFLALVLIAMSVYHMPTLVAVRSPLWYMLYATFFLFVWRAFFRFFCVRSVYGWRQGLISVPRLFWANIVNFFATVRALHIYSDHVFKGKPLAWDKTAHVYPTEEELKTYRKRMMRHETSV